MATPLFLLGPGGGGSARSVGRCHQRSGSHSASRSASFVRIRIVARRTARVVALWATGICDPMVPWWTAAGMIWTPRSPTAWWFTPGS
eukprot:9377303-Pyramimonas_sp.AAC.1